MVIHTISLCTGLGGLDLGLREGFRRLGITDPRTVCYIEREAYPVSLLEKKMLQGTMDLAPIWSDLTTFNGSDWRGKVHCIIGGYPCQPFSLAGKQLGRQDDRHLWPHIARLIREIKPSLCFFENVYGHLHNGLRQVVSELQAMGYEVAISLYDAEEVGAIHLRKRIFILAVANGNRSPFHVQSGGAQRGELTRIPTLTVCGNGNRKGSSETSADGLGTWAGGPLNPRWLDWFMGYPIGWTQNDHWEMPLYQHKPQARLSSAPKLSDWLHGFWA